MKKFLAFILAAIMICIPLSSCGATAGDLAAVKEAGKLTVATSPDFPPFETLEGDKVVGIEVDILNLIAKELGVDSKTAQKLTSYLTKAATKGNIETVEVDAIGENAKAQQIINEIISAEIYSNLA